MYPRRNMFSGTGGCCLSFALREGPVPKASQPLHRCNLLAENLYRSPMTSRFVICRPPHFGKTFWQRVLHPARFFHRPSAMFGITALCYRSVSSGRSMTDFWFHPHDIVSHAGRVKPIMNTRKMSGYLGQTLLNIYHSL